MIEVSRPATTEPTPPARGPASHAGRPSGAAESGRRPRQRVALTHQGWYYLALAALALFGALFRELNLLMLLAGMLAGPLVFNLLAALVPLRRLTVERVLPEIVCAGDRFGVELAAINPRRRAVWGLVLGDAVRSVAAEPGGAELGGAAFVAAAAPRVDGGGAVRIAYQARLHRRGRYRFGPLTVSSHFPLGLVRRSLTAPCYATLTVYPRLGVLARGLLRFDQEVDRGEDRLRQRQGSLDGEFYGLRGWRSSDGRRKIHWRSSARAGELMVRQFERQRSQELTLVVDPWLPAAQASDAALTNVELAISCAATILSEAIRHGGCQIMLVVCGPRGARRQGAASPGFLREALETLALAEPYHGPTAAERSPQRLRGAARSTVVWVTTRDDAPANGQADGRARTIVLPVGAPEFAAAFRLEEPT